MSYPSDCPACAMGNHEGHDPDHGTRPGLIGGTHCDCPGGCSAPDLFAFLTVAPAGVQRPGSETQP